MRPVTVSTWKRLVAAAIIFTLSACGHNEETLRSVSDFCLNDQPLSVDVAPVAGADDPGNRHDSESTVLAVFSHNAVYHDLCDPPKP